MKILCRGSVGEFMSFMSRTVAERTPQGQRQSVQEANYTAHVYNRGGAEQLAGTLGSTSARSRTPISPRCIPQLHSGLCACASCTSSTDTRPVPL